MMIIEGGVPFMIDIDHVHLHCHLLRPTLLWLVGIGADSVGKFLKTSKLS